MSERKHFKRQDQYLDAYKDHKITTLEEYNIKTKRGEFLWAKEGTCIESMSIIFRPSTIIIYGDMGSWVFNQYDIDLAWLRGAIGNPNYLFEKLTPERRTAYDSDATKNYATECLKERFDEGAMNIEEYQRIWDKIKVHDWDDARASIDFFDDELGYSDGWEMIVYSWDALGAGWIWAGLKTFLEALDGEN